MDFSTIILRFRDLVTENGKTNETHKNIIDNNNNSYVWWAWWKKGREKTPIGEIAKLNEIAKNQKINIFLVDSGNDKLYNALCSEIKFSSTEEESPEKDKTPEYYRDNSYHVWFKFEKIEDCERDELKKYSYVDIESLFEDNEDDYSLFNDKVVFDTKELIQQNRTLWFIREFREGDKENEIKLLNSNYIEPSNFSVKFNELTGNSLLWLSDLHLSNDVLNVTPGEKSLTNHIKTTCSNFNDDLFSDIAALIISGDITNCCSEDGFSQAETMITNLNRELGGALDNQRIIISPGNHDFKRIDTSPPKDNEDEYKEPDYYWDHPDSSEFFSKFYKDIFRIKPNKFMANGRKYLTQSGKTVEIVALNTMILQQYKGFEGHGYVSQEQLDFVEKEMNWQRKSAAIRIVVMHHHYCPACLHEQMSYDKAGSVVYDADRLIRWSVKNNVKLILHGHKHNEYFSKVSIPVTRGDIDESVLRDIYVVSLGGTGAKDTEHKFATITFDDDKLIARIFKFYPDLISDNVLDKTITIPYEANK